VLRDLPISRQRLLAYVLCVVFVLVLAGRYVLPARTAGPVAPLPPVGAALGASARPPALLVVDVVGAVRQPGLYRLRKGSRIADAVARAGGAAPNADIAAVNLAAPLADGVQIVVPRRGAVSSVGTGTGAGAAGSPGPVDLNTATLEQLDALPGVGPVTAQKILDYRQQHGSFTAVAQLDAIPGIGPARLEQLKGLVVP
jgi:competence protein ComEA